MHTRVVIGLFASLFSTAAFAAGPTPSKFPAPYVCTRNFYVTTGGTNSATCGTVAAPCATIAGADAATSIGGTGTTLTGGDCVNVGAGTYTTVTGNVTLTHGGTSASRSNGLLNGYVFYVGAPNHASILPFTADGGGNAGIRTGASYVGYDGFEIKSDHTGLYGGAIQVGTLTQTLTGNFHHAWILNNLLHGFAQGGIEAGIMDYAFIYNNEIYDNSQQCPCNGSGYGMYEPIAIPGFNYSNGIADDTQTFHLQFVGNVSHDNNVGPSVTGTHYDGNGLSLDDFPSAQWTGGPGQYPFQALVEGNVSYHNGGRGFEQQNSANVTWINNTAYNNCTDTGVANCGEFGILGNNQNSTTSSILNNIAIRNQSNATGAFRFDGGPNAASGATNNETYDIVSGGNSVQFISTGNDANNLTTFVAANPKVGTNPLVTSLATPDFHLSSTSPALGAGAVGPGGYPLYTPDGFVQPPTPNLGAYVIAGGGGGGGIVPLSINAGGAAASPFVADTLFSGGQTIQNGTGTTDLTGCTGKCAPNAVYQTERYSGSAGGSFSYVITGLAASTNYLVRLHFSEDWPADEVVGGRLEDVTINAVNVLSSFDIYHTAGNVAHKAVVQDFTKASDATGKITVAFVAHAGSPDQYAKVDGIEILQPAPPLLQTLALASNTMHTCVAQGTDIGIINGTTSGSTVTIGTQSTTNALQVAQVGSVWHLQVGSAALCGAHTYTVSLVETLAGATGSPKTTSGLSVTETCP